MEECDEAFDEMTEGQLADHVGGFWVILSCPQCGFTDLYKRHFSSDYDDNLSGGRWEKPNILSSDVEKEKRLARLRALLKMQQLEREAYQLVLKARGGRSGKVSTEWECLPLSERLYEACVFLRKNLGKLPPDEGGKAVNILQRIVDRGHRDAVRLYPDPLPCEICGATEDIARHHLNQEPWDNRRTNIAFLCEWCHGRFGHPELGNFGGEDRIRNIRQWKRKVKESGLLKRRDKAQRHYKGLF